MLERASCLRLRPSSSLSRLIYGCTTARELQRIHSLLITTGHPDPRATAALLRRLLLLLLLLPHSAVPSSLPYATSLFLRAPEPDLFAYNAMIRAYARPSPSLEPTSLYVQMLAAGVRPDHFTFPFLLKRCSLRIDQDTGRGLHSHVLQLGFRPDIFIQNALVSMYSTCGLISCARRVFDGMRVRDVVSWNSLLIGYLRCGELDAASSLFLAMDQRNVRTWNSIVTGFVQGGRAREALAFFHEMLQFSVHECVRPDKITIASVISACASLGALDHGRWVHGYLKRHELEFDVVIGTALIDMYGKCGCVERALEVFEDMREKDVMAWTAMISALAIHGRGHEALDLLEEMERHGVKPNQVTFGALLSACAHSGLVEKGRWCFDMMKRVYSIEPRPQHYACMVDLLGRAGIFKEAEELIRSMPMEADAFVWGALLGACMMHRNVELGERVANYLIRLDPDNHAFYIILSDIFAKANRFADVKKVRSYMKEQGIMKMAPGCSMIELDGQVHEFSVKGSSDTIMKEIQWVLDRITEELKLASYSSNDNEEWLEITIKN